MWDLIVSVPDHCLSFYFSLFSEFEPGQNLDQSQMSFDYLMGYIMSISMCMQISSQYSTQFKR